MNVLIDMEWVQSGEEFEITQIAAVRVSEQWDPVDSFHCLVCPVSCWDADWDHMAYNGYSPDEFRAGLDEPSSLLHLLRFLRADDTVVIWHRDTERVLRLKCETVLGVEFPFKCRHVAQKVRGMASARGIGQHGLYEISEAFGFPSPAPQHQSVNDVLVLRRLLSRLRIRFPAGTGAVQPPPEEKTRREKNLDMLSRSQYKYIFTPSSHVFHRATCHLMLNARTIEGTVRYRKACKDRVPCKVCHPQPPGPWESPPAQKKRSPEPIQKELVKAKVLGDYVIEVANTKIIGHCYNRTHPGDLTLKIMEAHGCLQKECPFLKKYEDRPYWIMREAEKRRKAARKLEQRAEKRKAQKQAEALAALRDSLQSCADGGGPPMYIVRLELEGPYRYKVFYVSEDPFDDGDRFGGFLDAVRRDHPDLTLQLRHIRHVDGHFVTTHEFLARKR